MRAGRGAAGRSERGETGRGGRAGETGGAGVRGEESEQVTAASSANADPAATPTRPGHHTAESRQGRFRPRVAEQPLTGQNQAGAGDVQMRPRWAKHIDIVAPVWSAVPPRSGDRRQRARRGGARARRAERTRREPSGTLVWSAVRPTHPGTRVPEPIPTAMNVSAYSSASWGMADAMQRFDGAAQNIATGSGDLATDMVEGTMLAPTALALNAQVVRTVDEAHQSLFDAFA